MELFLFLLTILADMVDGLVAEDCERRFDYVDADDHDAALGRIDAIHILGQHVIVTEPSSKVPGTLRSVGIAAWTGSNRYGEPDAQWLHDNLHGACLTPTCECGR